MRAGCIGFVNPVFEFSQQSVSVCHAGLAGIVRMVPEILCLTAASGNDIINIIPIG